MSRSQDLVDIRWEELVEKSPDLTVAVGESRDVQLGLEIQEDGALPLEQPRTDRYEYLKEVPVQVHDVDIVRVEKSRNEGRSIGLEDDLLLPKIEELGGHRIDEGRFSGVNFPCLVE